MRNKTVTLLSFCFVLIFSNLINLAVSPRPGTSKSPFEFVKDIEGAQKGTRAKGIIDLKQFLKRFGYLGEAQPSSDDLFDEQTESGVRAYQRQHNLEITGTLTPQTVSLMSRPRCGVKEKNIVHNTTGADKLFGQSLFKFLDGNPKWPPEKSSLTFAFKNETEDLVTAVKDSLSKWQAASHFKFQMIDDFEKADLKISFEENDHGDGTPFDGAYAHADPPTFGGTLHLSYDWNWSLTTDPKFVNLYSVTLHELGHALGLDHSKVEDAIMWPYLDLGTLKKLTDDDIQGIKALYNQTS